MAGALCLSPASAGKSFAAPLLLRRVPTAPSAALPAPMRGKGWWRAHHQSSGDPFPCLSNRGEMRERKERKKERCENL